MSIVYHFYGSDLVNAEDGEWDCSLLDADLVNAKAAVDMSPYSATLAPKRPPSSSESKGPTEEDNDAEQTPVAHGIGTSSSDDHSVTTVIETSTQGICESEFNLELSQLAAPTD